MTSTFGVGGETREASSLGGEGYYSFEGARAPYGSRYGEEARLASEGGRNVALGAG